MLSFFDESDQIKHPCGGTRHHFVKYRLGGEGINEIMMFLGEKNLKFSPEKEAKINSTPLETSRYNKHADYNPALYKWLNHCINRLAGYPIFLIKSNSLDYP